jgi:hypothetical protein
MNYVAPYTDVRVEAPRTLSVGALGEIFLNSLVRINMNPPASGPEVELVFGTPEGTPPWPEEEIRAAVERFVGPVLAIRTRQAPENG